MDQSLKQEWTLRENQFDWSIMSGELAIASVENKPSGLGICDAHNVELAAALEESDFKRVQEQARQLVELREAIMGVTGPHQAIATHKQLLGKVAAERQRREQAEQECKTECELHLNALRRLRSAQAVIEEVIAFEKSLSNGERVTFLFPKELHDKLSDIDLR